MENIEITVTEDEYLLIRVDLKSEVGFTSGRKGVRIASTQGNVHLPGPNSTLRGERLNVNLWRPLTNREKREGAACLKSREEDDGQGCSE